MIKKHSAKIIVGIVVLLFSLLYTLPSTTLWDKMFGLLPPDEQEAVPLSGYEYQVDGNSVNLTVRANITAPMFSKENAPIPERVLDKIGNDLHTTFTEAECFAKRTKTDTKDCFIVMNISKGDKPFTIDMAKAIIAKKGLYSNAPLVFASLFPKKKITLGLDLRGGIDLVYEVDTKTLADDKRDSVADAVQRSVEIIRNRIDMYGIAEPSIKSQDDKRIRIQLPGVKDAERVKQLIQNTAMLKFHIVRASSPTIDGLGYIDPEKDIALMSQSSREQGALWYKLDKEPDVTGRDLKYASVVFDEFGKPIVNIEFNNQGSIKFSNVTAEHIGEQLAIVLDNKVHSAPVIQSRITGGKAQITGNFSFEDASNLAIVLRAGALPASLTLLDNKVVGPTLGQQSINAGLMAGILGFVCIIGYMILVYKGFGIYADMALIFNSLIVFATLVFFGGTMTMPGIAGFVLSLGMAVDANVIIFERIKEEYKSGKTVRAAVASGFDRAFSCIFDSNITTLLVVAVLYVFASGPIRGFATTLGIGLISNLYTAVVFTKLLLDIRFGDGKTQSINI